MRWVHKNLSPLALFLAALGMGGCLASQQSPTPTTQPSSALYSAEDILRYAVFPAPPYMIGASETDSAMSGIDVEIIREIARRMNLKIAFIQCTWARCLELMQEGDADLLSSAYKKADREEYMLYLDQPYLDRLPIAFYYLKGKGYVVNTYEDIYQFGQIGVLDGASYFERFDADVKAKKFTVSSQDQLFPMLLAGRLEAIAGYVPTENYRIFVEGYRDQIERSTYEYAEEAFVYMTVSKKSPFAARLAEFNQINQQLLDEGLIEQVISRYYEKYR